jgi:hypothetical protein
MCIHLLNGVSSRACHKQFWVGGNKPVSMEVSELWQTQEVCVLRCLGLPRSKGGLLYPLPCGQSYFLGFYVTRGLVAIRVPAAHSALASAEPLNLHEISGPSLEQAGVQGRPSTRQVLHPPHWASQQLLNHPRSIFKAICLWLFRGAVSRRLVA